MSVKPYITLLFLLSVLTILLVIAFLFPVHGIPIVKNMKIRFAAPEDIFSPEREEYADISDKIANAIINDSILETLSNQEKDIPWDTVRANEDSLKSSIARIKFPRKNKKLLYPAFRSFDRAKYSDKPVRIMHYGDSQIEGDRISSFIRNRLQKKFGGSGVGLVPVEQTYDFKYSIFQENSDNWYRYTLYGQRDTSLSHNRYGALASFCRFTPADRDIENPDTSIITSWVSFSPSDYSYSNTKSFRQCRLFYSHNTQPFIIELYQGEALLEAEMYPESSSLQTVQWTFDEPVGDIKIVFKGTDSPDIYGIALDDKSGIAVDNVAMRGCSGLIFTKMDKSILKAHYEALNVKMIILQFGGNVVPHITDDYGYYERLFGAQLKRIKQILPDVAIVVIGVADMSIKKKDRYVSYPNIEKIRDAMKNAAFDAGCAYWDMYEAMGGKNSMPSWVFANPSLASKDFVHFNTRGARIIANMFYNSLMYEYNLYKKDTSAENE